MMKVKNIILITILFIGLLSFGQNSDFTNISIPSVQASTITKFSNVNVNESLGSLNINIPILEYHFGEINVPINISYNGTGVQVSQKPTWTGMNWSLNAGGVITRVVKDLPDDRDVTRFHYTSLELENQIFLNSLGQTLPSNIYNNLVNSQTSDSEYDSFYFNFLNYSGEFIIKENLGVYEIVLGNLNDGLKFEIIGSFEENQNYEFVATDENGFKYYFGGLIINSLAGYAVEETQLIDKNTDPTGNNNLKAKTAFYLTKIISPKGDQVFFDYENIPKYNIYQTLEQYYEDAIFNGSSPCGINSQPITTSSSIIPRIIYNNVFKGKYLKKYGIYKIQML